jgi:hypothetical protein
MIMKLLAALLAVIFCAVEGLTPNNSPTKSPTFIPTASPMFYYDAEFTSTHKIKDFNYTTYNSDAKVKESCDYAMAQAAASTTNIDISQITVESATGSVDNLGKQVLRTTYRIEVQGTDSVATQYIYETARNNLRNTAQNGQFGSLLRNAAPAYDCGLLLSVTALETPTIRVF